MPKWYSFICSSPDCSYEATRYRNCKRCPECGSDLVRIEPPTPREMYEREKKARIYYQEKVYATCRALDAIDGHRVASGKGIVCGTAKTPADQIEKRLERLVMEYRQIARKDEETTEEV